MAWLVGGILTLMFVALMINSPGFRNGVIVILILVGTSVALYIKHDEAKTEKSKKVISVSEIEIREPRLQSGGIGKEFVAILKNNNESFPVSHITFEITLYDCPKDISGISEKCETIGQSDATSYADIPQGQVRQISANAYFNSTPPIKGKIAWSYKIKEIRAEMD